MDQMPLHQGKMMSVWPPDVSVRSGRVALVRLCMHACMYIWYVFNCGFKLLSGRLIRKYMYGYTYMEVFTITLRIFHYGFRAEMKFYAGTLTTKHVALLVTLFMRERMYATVYAARSFNFPKFVRTYGTCMYHDKSFITYLHCSSPDKFLIHYILLLLLLLYLNLGYNNL